MSTAWTRAALLGDAVLAAALAAVAIVTTAGFSWGPQPGAPVDARGVALLGAAGLVLAVRRRWPLATLAATTVIITGYLLLGYPFGLIFLSFAVAVYTVARHRRLTTSAPASVAALALLMTHLFVTDVGATLGIVLGAAWAAIPFAIGVTVQARHEVALRVRAELIRTHVDDERLRVAQEVHDIVGHGLAAIKMQADIALHVLSKKPDQAETALAAISRTSRDALAELRAALAAVRDTGGDTARSPAPGLGRLDELQRRMREAGLQVEVGITGKSRGLPPVVDLTGYRIVQESLTNVLRHSGAAHATVTVRYAPAEVAVAVTNPVDRPPLAGGGSGISGMRQRVHALGGTFSAGPTPDGRFEVHASLPTGDAT